MHTARHRLQGGSPAEEPIELDRRSFLKTLPPSAIWGAAALSGLVACGNSDAGPVSEPASKSWRMGLSTTKILDWNLDRLIRNCEKIDLDGVELALGQAHGVAAGLSTRGKKTVRQLFDSSGLDLVGLKVEEALLDPDPQIQRSATERLGLLLQLSAELGGSGVRVAVSRTAETAASSLERWREELSPQLLEKAKMLDQRLHWDWPGSTRQALGSERLARCLKQVDSEFLRAAWTSEAKAPAQGDLRRDFETLAPHFGSLCEIHEIDLGVYPYEQLAQWLVDTDFEGWALIALHQPVSDAVSVLIEHRKNWTALETRARKRS